MEYITPDEAARLLKVSRWSIFRMVKRGELPAAKVGRLIRIPAAAVDDLAKQAGHDG